ncbi:MAG: hypothetical protein HUU37_01840 [Bdellovibrionales bacterium]|nr:hypothetical protein [Bdellovibrionales bacterium]
MKVTPQKGRYVMKANRLVMVILMSAMNAAHAGTPGEDRMVADLAERYSRAEAPAKESGRIDGEYECRGWRADPGVVNESPRPFYLQLRKSNGTVELRLRVSYVVGHMGGGDIISEEYPDNPDYFLVFTGKGLVHDFSGEAKNGTKYLFTLYHRIGEYGELFIQRSIRLGDVVKEKSGEIHAKRADAVQPFFPDEKLDALFLCGRKADQ